VFFKEEYLNTIIEVTNDLKKLSNINGDGEDPIENEI